MTILHHEIMEQPEALTRLLTQESANIQQVATAIHKRSPRYVMIAARGSSDNAARYAQYLFGAHNRLPVALATPSLFTLYQTPPDLQDALVLAVSQSGQSPDICAVVEEGRRQGALTITLTNDATSPLANLAELCIQMHAGPEKAIAATKTYTNSLLAIAMLSCALTGVKEHQDALQGMPEQVAWTLRQDKSIIEAAKQYRQAEACVTMGRGYNFSTAFELALKLKELAYIPAEPYSSADFQHGPVALVQDGFLVLAVVPNGKPAEELRSLLDDLGTRGARLVTIAPEGEPMHPGEKRFHIQPDLPEWLSPIPAIIPGQLFALGLAQARGLDPDHPRGLKKVTRTR